jgi:hypothetical protein
MMRSIETKNLIQDLARQAGSQHHLNAISFDWLLLVAVGLSLAVAAAMVFVLIGVRPDFGGTVQRAPFHYKIAVTLSMVCAGFFFARRAGQPDRTKLPLIAPLPALLLLALGASTDTSGLPVTGSSGISVPACVGAILVVSLPALAVILGVLRSRAPTRLVVAGATAGLLSGAVGATAYTLACKNDGALFIAVWYSAAILIMTGLGAAIGRRALAW